jgi:hypothetical protein
MKRALNKGVKKYVKLLWGKRSMPDSGRLLTRRSSPAHSAAPGPASVRRGAYCLGERGSSGSVIAPWRRPDAGLRTAPSGLDAGVMAPSDPS